jgi:hypothetical protein
LCEPTAIFVAHQHQPPKKSQKEISFFCFSSDKARSSSALQKEKVKSEKETFGKYENVAGSRD